MSLTDLYYFDTINVRLFALYKNNKKRGKKVVDFYASWVRGLPQDREALKILAGAGLGVEMSNLDEQVEMVQKAGVKFSAHTPGLDLTLNLASLKTVAAFYGDQGERLLEVIAKSDPDTVGFHLGYSAYEVVKMKGFPNLPRTGTVITNGKELFGILTVTIREIQEQIYPKRVLLETLDWSLEGLPIPWDLQSEEIRAQQEVLEQVVAQHGINAALGWVTSDSFISMVLKKTGAGFLFDVAHNWISYQSKESGGKISTQDVWEYFHRMLCVPARIEQLHVNVPGGDKATGYKDHHRVFGDDELSQKILELTQYVYKEAREQIALITLEMNTGLPPVNHAREMVRQVERLRRELAI